MRNTIVITSPSGDPKHPRTWSGTTSSILQALERQECTILGIDSSIKSKYEKLIFWLLHKALRFGFDFRKGRITREYCARVVQQRSKAFGCTKILHTALLDISTLKADATLEHYWLGDSTWNLWSQYIQNAYRYTPKMFQQVEQLERESFAQIKHFFPISEYVRDNLIAHYKIDPMDITVVGTGRGKIEPFTGEKDYTNGCILFVAKARFEDKGGPLLLEGFKIAQQRKPNLKLVIVGDDKYKSLIGTIPNVTITGYISWSELQHLFNSASLFAMPALNEPWGLVYLEALACKIPVLGLNRNSLPEISHHGQYGFLVNEPNPVHIADAILYAFSNPDNLRAMGAAGQKYCLETFSWDRVASKISSVMLETSTQNFHL